MEKCKHAETTSIWIWVCSHSSPNSLASFWIYLRMILSLSLNEYVCKDVALVFIAAYSYACGVCVHFFYYFTIVFTTTYPSIYTYTFTWPCIHISIYIVICTLYINVYLTTKIYIYIHLYLNLYLYLISMSNIYIWYLYLVSISNI